MKLLLALLPFIGCATAVGTMRTPQPIPGTKTKVTVQSMLKTIWNNGGEQTTDNYKYSVGYGRLAYGPQADQGFFPATKNLASEGNFDGTAALVSWGGDQLECNTDNEMFMMKINVINDVKLTVGSDAEGALGGWLEHTKLNYYVIDGDIINQQYYGSSKTKAIAMNGATSESIPYSVNLTGGQTFVFEFGVEGGKGGNWQGFAKTYFEFEEITAEATYSMSSIVTSVISSHGSDVSKSLVDYNVKHGSYGDEQVLDFDGYEGALTTTSGDAQAENWRIQTRNDDGIIFLFKVKKYSTFKVYREQTGTDWFTDAYLNIFINDELVEEKQFTTTDLSNFDFEHTAKIGDVIAWEFSFPWTDYRKIAMLDGGDIVTSMPKFEFAEIVHEHSWSPLGNGKEPYCDVDGWKDYSTCECGLYAEDALGASIIGDRFDLEAWKVGSGKIPATGEHSYGQVSYYWTFNDSSCVASRECEVCHHVETQSASSTVTHIKLPTCEEYGLDKYEATFANPVFGTKTKNVPVKPLGHNLEVVQGKEATCTEDGYRGCYHCSVCNKYFEDEECTKPISDLNLWRANEGKINVLDHDLLHVSGVTPTCTTPGYNDYYRCSVCLKYFEDEECTKPISDIEAWKNGDGKLEATGHEFDEPIYKWSDDNSSCTASRTCKHEGCIEIETETVKAVEKDGKIVATFTNPAFAEQFKDKPANTGLIIGLSVGGGALLVGAGVAIFFVIRKKTTRIKEQ